MSFVVLLPVKPPAWGKSRLVGLAPQVRRDLAEAFALDTLAAVRATPLVAQALVITDDASLASRVAAAGAQAIPDGTTWGMNPALQQGAAEARRRWPDLQPVALCADLPALRAADLNDALAAIEFGTAAFVADAAGTGTALYSAAYERFVPEFGVDSRWAHRDAGAVELAGSFTTLRRDVDDLDDLRDAVALGVGPLSAAVLADVADM